ncbi:N,N'-diacetylchitobiose transport system permease protein [Micrococcales bacterium KH10]|nr:N,N'-diacetylchitobiose transport system permease protein [Micrococcales bacterium KH10]
MTDTIAPSAAHVPPDTTAQQPQRRQEPSGKKRRGKLVPYLLLTPAILGLLAGLGYPLYWQFTTAFKEYGLRQAFGAPAEWVWFDNFTKILTDDAVWAVVVRSLAFCLVNALLTVAIGLALALLMRAVSAPIRITIQIAMLLAWAMPMVASVTVFKWLFNYRTGLVNWVLVKLGMDQFENYSWFSSPWTFFLVATMIVVWMSVPFVALSLYAGLTSVPDEIVEAARIDGASSTQILWRILVPMIKSVLSIVLLLQIIWDLRVFGQINLLQQQGAPVGSTNLFGNFIYEVGVGRGDFGTAAAVSLFVLALTMLISWPYVRSLMKEEENS